MVFNQTFLFKTLMEHKKPHILPCTVATWSLLLDIWLKSLSQTSHLNFFWPRWTTAKWRFRVCSDMKDLSQTSHLKITGLSWSVFEWRIRWTLRLKFWLQKSHLNFWHLLGTKMFCHEWISCVFEESFSNQRICHKLRTCSCSLCHEHFSCGA